MGAGAQVSEVALGVQADNSIFRQVVDQFNFIDFLFRGKTGQRVLAGHFAAYQRNVLFDNFRHFFFDGGQIFRREDVLAVDIIIEAGVDGGADSEFHTREQMLNSLGHHMGRSVPDGMQSFFRVGGYKFNSCIFFNGVAEVFVYAVYNS